MTDTRTSHANPKLGKGRLRISSRHRPMPLRAAAWATGVIALGLSNPAMAQGGQSQVPTGVQAEVEAEVQSAAEPRSGSQFSIGLGTAYLPRYEGANEHKLRVLPLINYRNGRFFAGVLTGIGYNFSPIRELEFGPIVSYRFGRDEDDSRRLRGLGDVDGGADAGVFARWNLRPFFVHGSVRHGVGGGPNGTSVRLGGGWATTLGPADRLLLDLSVEWTDREIMQAYFGVSGAQSARSGMSAYQAGSGIRRSGLNAAWTHAFTPNWFSIVGATFYRLGAEAADSPIVQQRHETGVSAALGYRF